jgi:hypothetical protein
MMLVRLNDKLGIPKCSQDQKQGFHNARCDARTIYRFAVMRDAMRFSFFLGTQLGNAILNRKFACSNRRSMFRIFAG